MLRPNGFTIVTTLEGKTQEGETFQCKHCGAHTHIKAFQRPEDIGGHCRICDGLICPRCAATGLCDPMERKLERWEKVGVA